MHTAQIRTLGMEQATKVFADREPEMPPADIRATVPDKMDAETGHGLKTPTGAPVYTIKMNIDLPFYRIEKQIIINILIFQL